MSIESLIWDLVPRARVDVEDDGGDRSWIDVVLGDRRVVVEHAPALFLVACGDPACRDGGHDITGDILRGLREHRAEIRGEDTCFGSTGSAECGRVIGYAAFAEYKPQV